MSNDSLSQLIVNIARGVAKVDDNVNTRPADITDAMLDDPWCEWSRWEETLERETLDHEDEMRRIELDAELEEMRHNGYGE